MDEEYVGNDRFMLLQAEFKTNAQDTRHPCTPSRDAWGSASSPSIVVNSGVRR